MKYPHPGIGHGFHEDPIETCGRPRPCVQLVKVCVGNRSVYKCELRGISASAASDHRLSSPACRLKIER